MSGQNASTHSRINVTQTARQIHVVVSHPQPAPVADNPAAAQAQAVSKALPQEGHFATALRELDQMIGLENVKTLIFEIYALLQIMKLRSQAGLALSPQVYHMIFKGNPGTGKTTVARIVAKLFQSMGMLSKGHLIEVERADLVGEYIGHTALKTRELMKKAMGGVLFIDEAYSLARGGEKDFGKEAIDALVKGMEDHKNQFILILAGYSDEMEQFLLTNPGLPSRFPIQLDFEDYTVDQLVLIADKMMKEREYTFHPHALMKLRQHLTVEKQECFHGFSNARYVRNILEKALRQQAVRLLQQYPSGSPGKHELMMLLAEDFKLPQ
ncbi:AAA family ATPase [Paenibacillus sp. y28]|uniref:AAA family ATPase n=1 Tax=Paenibacillus sp. y28 TaxID=3129110 RepID=UPI003019BDDA